MFIHFCTVLQNNKLVHIRSQTACQGKDQNIISPKEPFIDLSHKMVLRHQYKGIKLNLKF